MSERMTRRRLVGTGLAAGAGLAAGGVPAAIARRRSGHRHPDRHVHHADVAIVGAGFAGLTTARELVRKGRSVVVLEARDRVGGRVLNRHVGHGVISEGGATFVGPTQDHVMALARDLGVKKFPAYDTGDNVYVADGERITYSDTSPAGIVPLDPLIVGDAVLVVTELDQMATTVPVDAPWEAANAGSWDRQTLEDWMRANSSYSVNSHFQKVVKATTRPDFGAEPRELSLLFTVFYIAASGDETHQGTFERNFNTREGAQMWRFYGGSQRIAEILAKRLGGRVRLRSPVRRIEQGSGGVRLISDRLEVHAKRAVVAVPPEVAGYIRFDPELPTARARLNRRLRQGTLIKVAAVYETPFWRDDGLTGTVVALDGPVSVAFDDAPPSGKPGIVIGFIGGDNARAHRRLSSAARRKAVLDEYVSCFGPKAAAATDYLETDWSRSAWTRGCPVGIAAPGVLTACGPALRKPVGRIHWAGTETSTYWNGYMDGAVRSGERAAAEVLDEL